MRLRSLACLVLGLLTATPAFAQFTRIPSVMLGTTSADCRFQAKNVTDDNPNGDESGSICDTIWETTTGVLWTKTSGTATTSGWVALTTSATTGTVTSVALTAPGIFSVAGTPITTSGTLAISLATQSAQTFFAGPASGAAAAPTFRQPVLGDLAQSSATTGQIPKWDGTVWAAADDAGASSGAPVGVQYLTLATDATLTNERVLTAGTGLAFTDGGAGSTLTVDFGATLNFSAKTVRVPNSTTLPATCTVGDSYMDTNATTGQRWYLCESTDTWAVQGGAGGSSNSFETIAVSGQSNVVADASTDTLTLVAGSNVTLTTNAGTDTVTIAASAASGDSTTTDTQANQPAATNDGNLFFPSNGFYVWRDTGATLTPWGPIYPMTPPVSGDFAWINQGAATVSTTNGGVYLFGPKGTGHNWRIRKKAAPSTPYTITVGFLPALVQVTSQRAGPLFHQSSDGKFVVFQVFKTSTGGTTLSVEQWTNPTTFSASYTNIGFGALDGSVVWLRIADDGTNRICSYSRDGQNFIVFHSVGRTNFLTADEVGFAVDDESNLYDVGMTLLSWKQG